MGYRSFKRVLGESSLERKCRFLFGACLLLLITGSFWWYGQQTENLVLKQNKLKGDLLLDTVLAQKHWEKLETNVEFAEVVPELIKELDSKLQQQEYSWKFIRPDNLEAQQLTPDERRVLDAFLSQPVTKDGPLPAPVERYPNDQQYDYYRPVYATHARCIECHRLVTGPPDLAEMDLIAVGRVSISTKATREDMGWNRAILISAAIVTVFLAMIASYIIVRYVIVKPLKHLRDVSDAVSRGDLDQRAEIHTSDEFEELGTAFNRMLRHLVATQEELRDVNADLDLKVDQLAQANMRLFEMNRLKGDFLATMSHELRTPLNSILGFSEVLGSNSALDDKQKRYVQNIQKSGKMLLDMINDILDLAKIESGKTEVRLVDFRIDQAVHALCDLARPLAEKKNIDLVADVEPGLPFLHQDQGKVQQILNNLLSNAVKFTPEGGRIVVTARRADQGDLLLTVSDTGVGIAEEDRAHIFEKFRQGRVVQPDDAMTREYSGTGLGLSIVRELCRLLGGEVSLRSELGKGSEFTVRLPWVLSEPARPDASLNDTIDELTRLSRADLDRALNRPAASQPAAS